MTVTDSWSTQGRPATAVQDAWCEKMSELHLPWALSFPREDRFEAALRYRRLDGLTVSDFRGGGYSGQRTGSACEPQIGVLINLSGQLLCRHGNEELLVGPDELLLWDSELAYGFDAVEPRHELSLLLPRDRVPQGLAAAAARSRGAVSVAAGSGLSAIAADQLRAITRELNHLGDAGLAIAAQCFFDTLDTALAPLSASSASPNARQALVLRARRYIEEHLDDPDLCAASIAEAYDVSVRTLHLSFGETGSTVGRWIRERRLKVCYRELVQARGNTTVTDVAFRWGFNDMAHFSKVFKQAYGVPPSSVIARHRPVAAE
ncbi:helix-turn-helix domain-containing protein [Streptomyces sp. NPDC057253]|uniref:helix-turn-helix domain-containing protein n=1 Tax=Streptomyces sp. NPDC057253 TaxID=3346069 RepID=UPI00362F0B9C